MNFINNYHTLYKVFLPLAVQVLAVLHGANLMCTWLWAATLSILSQR